ncbi:hypothetical protein C9374_013619 [Naegleria lovaniensis]|uniref:Uncharacterized protein n=1 Tax=Naegleria lovaniensis TaxID=51637 RepID=A0AA88GD77_NAELO|nr:uncharacterized protein C9374_013619 [Naegleria lovaniensis]KAG2372718.1 hypothetical protein C9374_013619 [Naegleria lovaniensis]
MPRRIIKRKSYSTCSEATPSCNKEENLQHVNDNNGDIIFDLVMAENDSGNIGSDDGHGSTTEHDNEQKLLLPTALPETHKNLKKKRRFHKASSSSAESSQCSSKTSPEDKETEKITFTACETEQIPLPIVEKIPEIQDQLPSHDIQHTQDENETRDRNHEQISLPLVEITPEIPFVPLTLNEFSNQHDNEMTNQEQAQPVTESSPSKKSKKIYTNESSKENTAVNTTKKASRPRKKKSSSTNVADTLIIDKDNKVSIGGDLYLVRKVSNLHVVDLSKYLSSLYSKKDLPGPLQELLDNNRYLLTDEKVKLNQKMYITCTMNAIQETTKKKVLLVLKGAEHIGGSTIQCHICRAQDGAKLICDNSTLFNILHFVQKYNVGKEEVNMNFSFPALPCAISMCKDCIETHDHGDFEYYATNGHFICPHCRSCCVNHKCYTRRNYPNGGIVKYNGRNAEEVFVSLAANIKYEAKHKTTETPLTEKKESPKSEDGIVVSSEENQSVMAIAEPTAKQLATSSRNLLRNETPKTKTTKKCSDSPKSTISVVDNSTSVNNECVSSSLPYTRRGFCANELKTSSLFNHEAAQQDPTTTRKLKLSKEVLQLKTDAVANYLIHSFSRHFSHRQKENSGM